MVQISTLNIPTESFIDEIIAAGVPEDQTKSGFSHSQGVLTLKNVSDEYQSLVEQVLAAHVPFFGHVETKIRETRTVAGRKISEIAPIWKQVDLVARSLELERKERKGGPLTPVEKADITSNELMRANIKSIQLASDQIEAEIVALSDTDAGDFDVEDHVAWPD